LGGVVQLSALASALAAAVDSNARAMLLESSYCGGAGDVPDPGQHGPTLGESCGIRRGCACVLEAGEQGGREVCISYFPATEQDCASAAMALEHYLRTSALLAWGLAALCVAGFGLYAGWAWVRSTEKRRTLKPRPRKQSRGSARTVLTPIE
jgi:hypothetical protein